jgi:hypothetical protein
MTSTTQTIVALAIVVVAAVWLVARAVAKRKNPGCSDDCGCAATELKAKLKR